MTVTFSPAKFAGEIIPPPSKCYTHRAMICAALAKGKSRISNIIFSDDMNATIDALRTIGAKIETSDGYCDITGIGDMETLPQNVNINCRESGSTLRFMMPVCAALGINAAFTGHGKLPSRPLDPYFSAMGPKGVNFNFNGKIPSISGRLNRGDFILTGDVSSQFFTGLFFALPLVSGGSTVEVTGNLESLPYLEITRDTLRAFGIEIYKDNPVGANSTARWIIPGNKKYEKCDYNVERDFSSAAFFAVAGAVSADNGDGIKIMGMNKNSIQGDKAVFDIISECGARVSFSAGTDPHESRYIVKPPSDGKLKPFNVNASDIPDLVPILAVLASFCEGTSLITGAKRLKIKESDRLSAISDVINNLGGEVIPNEDGLLIRGAAKLKGGRCDSHNDHRIAMSAAIMAAGCEAPSELFGAQAVRKSYPDFFKDYKKLGGTCYADLGF
ncbi:MAG: 3-phosphoshikimate 1-carboxyvinyltransferase [Oscillospiraceae bacterium]|nr:3-phosphoshikimate 1-carboxyvinyltransferase [Oscillospiraceae bacterium]